MPPAPSTASGPPATNFSPVPPRREGLLPACLEKAPARPPASAATLRDALRGLGDLGGWGERQAREWWDRWRERRGGGPRDVTAQPTRTLEVALDHRGGEIS